MYLYFTNIMKYVLNYKYKIIFSFFYNYIMKRIYSMWLYSNNSSRLSIYLYYLIYIMNNTE